MQPWRRPCNGALARDTDKGMIGVPEMVAAMAGEAGQELEQLHRPTINTAGKILVEMDSPWSAEPIHLRAGQIAGLAGLEGSGQRDFLRALYH